MWCPSCNEHYDEVVAPEQGVPFPYEHVTAFIARHLDRIRFVRPVEKLVAVHYHTGYPQSDADWQNTVRILQAIPGVRLVAIPHSAEMGRHCTPKWIGRYRPPALAPGSRRGFGECPKGGSRRRRDDLPFLPARDLRTGARLSVRDRELDQSARRGDGDRGRRRLQALQAPRRSGGRVHRGREPRARAWPRPRSRASIAWRDLCANLSRRPGTTRPEAATLAMTWPRCADLPRVNQG